MNPADTVLARRKRAQARRSAGRLARQFEQILPLKLIPPPLELPQLVEVLQWNIHWDLDPASRWLRSKLKEHADQTL